MTTNETRRHLSLSYDAILASIGQYGPWQRRNFLLLWLTSAAGGLAVVVFAFTGFVIKHRCAIPYCESAGDASYLNESSSALPNYAAASSSLSSCEYYGLKGGDRSLSCEDYVSMLPVSGVSNGSSELHVLKCDHDSLLFDHSIVSSSVTTDFGLVCDRFYYRDLLGSSYMVGMLIGSFVLGIVSDHIGRMKTLMLSVALVSVCGTAGAFMPEPISFAVMRILTGMGGLGCFMVTFVLTVEYVGPRFTMLIGIIIEVPFALGEMVLGAEAYFIRDWFTLQLVAYAPLALFLALWFIVPESPRWLLAAGRTDEAMRIIEKAAEVNGKTLPAITVSEKPHGAKEKEHIPTFFDLFRPRKMAFRTFNMFFQWFSTTLCYYGLSYASTSMAGSVYANFALSMFIEIPSYVFCILVMDCWGRRPILSFCQIVSGAACVCAGLLQGVDGLSALQVTLSTVGKFGASASFAVVYVYTAELFPTIIRNTAIGSCSTAARVGGIVALLIPPLAQVWAPLPMVLMGGVALVAGFEALLFPETAGSGKLPETLDEALAVGGHHTRGHCGCACPGSMADCAKYFTED